MHDLFLGWIFLYAFIIFRRNGIRGGQIQHKTVPKWGRVFLEQIWLFLIDQPVRFSTSCLLVPLFALAAHLSHIEFRPLRLPSMLSRHRRL